MGGAAILAITLIPILMLYFIRGKIIPECENPVARATMVVYQPVLAGDPALSQARHLRWP